MTISRKTTIIMGLAMLGSAVAGDWATTAGLAAVYCSQWAHCTNTTSCSMYGEMNKYMSLFQIQLSPGVKSLPFLAAEIVGDQAECIYSIDNAKKGGLAAFQAKPNELQPGKSSFWGDGVSCDGDSNGTFVAKRCPFVPRAAP